MNSGTIVVSSKPTSVTVKMLLMKKATKTTSQYPLHYLVSHCSQLLGKFLVVLARLISSVADIIRPDKQCGFWMERSTSDMIFVARLMQEKCREQHKHLYIAFVDLTKAFDTINREALWTILHKSGCTPKFTNILKKFHSGMFAHVVPGDFESDPFPVKVGVKQGCILAPVIFNIYLIAVTLLSHQSLPTADALIFHSILTAACLTSSDWKPPPKLLSVPPSSYNMLMTLPPLLTPKPAYNVLWQPWITPTAALVWSWTLTRLRFLSSSLQIPRLFRRQDNPDWL